MKNERTDTVRDVVGMFLDLSELPTRSLATLSDIRLALDAGFAPDEVEYMLDLPEGASMRALEIRRPAQLALAA